MKAKILILLLFAMASVSAQQPVPEWKVLCSLLKVKKSSEAFRLFRAAYSADAEIDEFAAKQGVVAYIVAGSVRIVTRGDLIESIQVMEEYHDARHVTWPCGIVDGDSIPAAEVKLGKRKLHTSEVPIPGGEYLMIDYEGGYFLGFNHGRISSVGMTRGMANHPAEPASPSRAS